MSDAGRSAARYGSEAVADLLRIVRVPFLTINPGASFRGLHDSIVNHLSNTDPALVLTLHEAQAVAMAQGNAKVSGKPMGVVLTGPGKTADGRKIRTLTIIDLFTRECLGIEVGFSLKAHDVVADMSRRSIHAGYPPWLLERTAAFIQKKVLRLWLSRTV